MVWGLLVGCRVPRSGHLAAAAAGSNFDRAQRVVSAKGGPCTLAGATTAPVQVPDSPEGAAPLDSSSVLLVMRHTVVAPPHRQNIPLLSRHAHLAALLAGADGSRRQHRNWTAAALGRVQALVPRIWEHRFP